MTPAARDLIDPNNLPPRLSTAQVCALAQCSETTLWRRRKGDPKWLPAAPVQLGKSTMFDRAAVLKALGMVEDASANDEWTVDPDAIRKARSRKVRHASTTARRDLSGAHGGSSAPPALRLVGGDPAPRHGR
jgi:hypothetical protein